MGQYHYAVNLDKRQYINPHGLGDGLKLWEQAGHSLGGVPTALVVLLSCSNGRGGGDFDSPAQNEQWEHFAQKYPDSAEQYRSRIVNLPGNFDPIGRWAGDRIAFVGDYAEDGDLAPEHEASTIYRLCHDLRDCADNECTEPVDRHFLNITPILRLFMQESLDVKYSLPAYSRGKSLDDPDAGWIQRD